jgi:hypothetical protein
LDERPLYKAKSAASGRCVVDKAPIHVLRIALTLAEAEAPGRGGTIGEGTLDRAAAIVNFTLGCWYALPERGAEWLTRREQGLDRAVITFLAWLEERDGREATRREIQRAWRGRGPPAR